MELVHVKCLILVLAVSYVVCEQRPGFIGRARRTSFSMMSRGATRMSNAGSGQTDEFPNELRYSMTMEGEETVDLHLVRDKFLHTPEMLSQDIDNTIRRKESNLNVAFYKDTNGYGSFACEASTDSNGDFSCSLSALLNMGQETCYVPPGSPDADCGTTEDGEILNFQEVNNNGYNSRELVGSAEVIGEERRRRREAELSNNETVSDRTKRSIFPEAGFKVVEVAYILDKTMMDHFYTRHAGDNAAAEAEADLYVTLLTNEMNVYYTSIKEVSGGALDLYLFPAAIVYPVAGSDFSWVDQHKVGSIFFGTNEADNDIATFVNGNSFTDKKWDHAMFLTGLTLNIAENYRVLGYAYVSTVCTTKSKRFSVNEATVYNIGRIGAHEIGHALSMQHDGNTACPINRNIMSPSIFSINSVSKDTYYKFSTCSVADVVNHLSLYPSCVVDNGFTDVQFKDKFCSGLPGAQDDSLDLQCRIRTGWTGSTPCNTPTSASDCYAVNAVSCSLENGGCASLRYVWQGTSCGVDKVCYKGDCVTSFDVCDVSTTSSTTTTSTTTSTTTTTTPTSTSTTTPTTTTTTTPTSTSTTTPTTTTTTTTTSTSTTTPTTTTTTPTSTTEIPLAPCTCCGYNRKKKTKKCCRKGRRRHNRQSCYCCYELKNVFPGPGFDGPRY